MRGMKWPGSALVWISAVTLGILCLAGCRLDSGADRNDNSARWRQTAENGQRERQESTEGGGGENGMGERQAAAGEDGEQARTHELKPPSPGHLKLAILSRGAGADVPALHRWTRCPGWSCHGRPGPLSPFALGRFHWLRQVRWFAGTYYLHCLQQIAVQGQLCPD